MVSPTFVVRNQLLRSLAPDVLAQLLPKLTSVELLSKQVLGHQDEPIESVYFVENGMISMVKILEDGMQAEVGIVGNEGLLGVSVAAGINTSFVEIIVQLPGIALKMAASDLRQQMETNPSLRTLLLRYNEALHAQVMQTAACNGRHQLEERLARWLLMAHDRADGNELLLTQDFIATMLGVHRPSITITAGILQRAGLIRYVTGRVTVLDRPSLEEASCECYAAVQKRFNTLMLPGGS